MSIKIISTASYTDDQVLTNDDLTKIVDTNDEWIRERTGIVQRKISKNKTTEKIAFLACKKAIEKGGIEPNQIGLILFASVTNDTKVPSSSFNVLGRLGIKEAICMDINAACSGFIYSLTVAKAMMKMQNIRYCLVVGSERLSKVTNWEDRSTCILFGDGSGAVLLENDAANGEIKLDKNNCQKFYNIDFEIKDQYIKGEYDKDFNLILDMKNDIDDMSNNYIEMNGRQIYKFATKIGPKLINDLLDKNNINQSDVHAIICHQANLRIIENLSIKTDIEIDKWFVNIEKYGNTSSASVPIALDEYITSLKENNAHIEKGKYVVLLAFGGGLSYGVILLKVI
ncbi:beta-ketoacyl-ACP synthase 3 [Peptostreptococcus equinus]|uniref:Beta-ketoacyl-ACP synthase 3 n=1 Tax=Peptostreptococcus equinus TaxID=3003601 RepID=A0ABY7JQP5_9FIRM|nr:beta-ketoacyl-ACP synthase 3 [Peptostreptococcus sp. CBA3647]WAW14295.1 beta-ketoacyl-ACP synthase 3 [Peptostreptococcus sp. CBA3647]